MAQTLASSWRKLVDTLYHQGRVVRGRLLEMPQDTTVTTLQNKSDFFLRKNNWGIKNKCFDRSMEDWNFPPFLVLTNRPIDCIVNSTYMYYVDTHDSYWKNTLPMNRYICQFIIIDRSVCHYFFSAHLSQNDVAFYSC